MATEESAEEKRLNEEFRKANVRFRELSTRTKNLADKTLVNTITATKLQAQTSAASEAMRGISNLAGPMRSAIQAAAKNSLFLGSALETTTAAVKVASKEYDKKTKDIQHLRIALGEDSKTIRGINQLENARKAAVQARVELYDKEIKQIDVAIASQNDVILKRQQEVTDSETKLTVARRGITSEILLIDAKTALIESIQDSIIAQQQKIDADNFALNAEKELKQLNEDQLAGLQRQKSVQEGLIRAKQAEIDAVDATIAQQRSREVQLQSELSQNAAKKAAIQAEIGAAVTVAQRSALESLHAHALEELSREEASLTQRLTSAQDSIAQEVSTRIDLANELRAQQTALADTTSEISRTQADIAASNTEITRLTAEISAGKGNMELLRTQLEAEEEARRKGTSKLADLQREEVELIKKVQDNKDALAAETSTLQELTEHRQNTIDDEAANKQKDLNDAIDAKRAKLTAYTDILNNVASKLNKLVAPILELQKQFGISAGSAAKLKFENLMASANSYMKSLMTGAPGVSAKEIEATQGAFQQEFGGILTSEAATNLATEAKRLGVGASEMAKARRVFMTQTMGDTGKAKAAQDKFIGEFAKKGLTAKDAMEAIGQNSNLLARNGTRFASSFARAAADAKKIGVDLSKIDQVGDNIIDNFEGFLESQSELGAMGFNFDTSKLAELAEGGDTGALMNELRSQLASTGKDITKLRRSEQLALSKSFGLSMEELQRMAGPTGGAGEATVSPEDLQKDANDKLGGLVFRANTIITLLGLISAGITLLNTRSLVGSLVRGGGVRGAVRNIASSVGGRVGGATTAIRGSRLGAAVGGMGTLARVGTGVGIGVAGELMSAGGEKLKESGYKKTGGAVSTLGEVAKYAGIGMMFGPVGAAVGGLVGAVVGITKNFDAWKEMGSAAFGAVTSALGALGGFVIKAGKWLFDAFMTLNPVSLISSLFSKGVGGTWDKVKSLNPFGGEKKGDDVVSKSGYGERTLVTPSGPIALNNNDNVIAYADDMISGAVNEGIRMLSYGALGQKEPAAAQQVNVDFTRLEQKLDAVVRAIGSMEVKMDGNKVGKVLVNTSDSARTVGVFRQDARATL